MGKVGGSLGVQTGRVLRKVDLHFVTVRKREREVLKPKEGLSHGKEQSWMGGSRDRTEAIISEAVGSDTSLPPPNPVPPPATAQVLVVHGIVKCLSRRDTAQEYVKVPVEFLHPESFQNLKAEGLTRRVADKNMRRPPSKSCAYTHVNCSPCDPTRLC